MRKESIRDCLNGEISESPQDSQLQIRKPSVLFLGKEGVGKTSLFSLLMKSQKASQVYEVTLQPYILMKVTEEDGIKYRCVDSPGSFSASLMKKQYKKAQIVVLVFSRDCPESLSAIPAYISSLIESKNTLDPLIILVQNKDDIIQEPQVQQQQIQNIIQHNRIDQDHFIRTSALNTLNCNTLLKLIQINVSERVRAKYMKEKKKEQKKPKGCWAKFKQCFGFR